MKTQKMPRRVRLFISIGLLMVTLPMLFREYIPLSDFFRGLLAGMGLTFEVYGLVLMRRFRREEAII
jgi:hypothetical protein